MSNNMLKLFFEKGFLLDKEMLKFLVELDDKYIANEILDKIAVASKKKIITKGVVLENIEKIKPILFDLNEDKKQLVDKYFVNIFISIEVNKNMNYDKENILAKDNKDFGTVKIISSPIIASQRLEVKNFVKHFRSRYNMIKKILQWTFLVR